MTPSRCLQVLRNAVLGSNEPYRLQERSRCANTPKFGHTCQKHTFIRPGTTAASTELGHFSRPGPDFQEGIGAGSHAGLKETRQFWVDEAKVRPVHQVTHHQDRELTWFHAFNRR